MQQDGVFRALVNRLHVTPTEDLPRLSAFLASSLATCPLEIYFSDAKTNASSVTAHKLKTRISALLQDRSQAGRLSAAIVIKTILETAGSNLLASSEPWARNLISCLSKAEAPEIKKLYLTTITRIFLLTQHQPALVREITTPLLPSFLTACLGLIRPLIVKSGDQTALVSSPLLDTVLRCWIHLLPHHASTFRPFLNRIKPICLSLIEDDRSPQSSLELSIRVLCSLISCAPKNTASQEWTQMSSSITALAHETAGDVFRAILEDHESNNSSRITNTKKHNFGKPPGNSGKDHLGLISWKGVSEGSSRLAALLLWFQHLLSSGTTQQVQVPFGEVLDLTTRILSVNIPESQNGARPSLRYHIEASKEEREELSVNLPKLHISCLALLWSLCTTYKGILIPLYHIICDQILSKFQIMARHQDIRLFCYDIIGHIAITSNLSELDVNGKAFSDLVVQVFNDLKAALPLADSNKSQANSKDLTLATKTVQSQTMYSIPSNLRNPSNAFSSAWKLLPILLGPGVAPMLPRQLRTEADKLAVLLDHQEAMLASVLNPVLSDDGSMATASILPFLTRTGTGTPAVEALLRPRLPPTQYQVAQNEDVDLDKLVDDPFMGSPEVDNLSQLEKSINAMDDRQGHVSSSAADQNGFSHQAVPPIKSPTLPKKRPFEDLKENGSPLTATEKIDNQIRIPKRARAGELLETIPASEENEMETTTAFDLPEANNKPYDDAPHLQPSDANVSLPVGNETSTTLDKGENYDSDSSDFEIPKIDTGLDTDEEEDDEEAES